MRGRETRALAGRRVRASNTTRSGEEKMKLGEGKEENKTKMSRLRKQDL